VIREAVLYLPVREDAHAAVLPVAGRAVAARVVLAAARAGIQRVRIPAALRTPEVERAFGAARARGVAISWLDQDSRPPSTPVLLVPATGLTAAGAIARLSTADPPAVLVESAEQGAPVVGADCALARTLWVPIVAGAALADALERELKSRAVARPLGGAWYTRITDAAGAARAEARLFAELGTAADTRLDLLLHRRLARPLTRVALRLGITPNQLTTLSLLLGLAAAYELRTAAVGSAALALVLYAGAVVLDHADGEVARLTGTESTFGGWFDVAADTIVHAALVVAMGLSAAEASGRGVAPLGLVAAAGIVLSAGIEKLLPEPEGGWFARLLARLSNRDGFYAAFVAFIVLLATAPTLLPVLLAVVTAGAHAYWVARLAFLAAARG
jgi:phosphatidylglycerophosphate synthase